MRNLLLLTGVLAFTAAANPVTIVSVTNANPIAMGYGVADTEFLQSSWSQTNDYTGAALSAWLFGDFVGGVYVPTSGTAYLTSDQGLNLTKNFTFPDPSGIVAFKVLLFSSVNLPAATYFLTLSAPDTYGGAWASDLQQSSTILLDSGVTLANAAFSPQANVNSANPPASTFFTVNPATHVFFEVSGTPVPEPASVILLGIGFLVFAVRRVSI
jgi:hypothetical protein